MRPGPAVLSALGALLLAAPPAVAARPSLAVFPLQAGDGVSAGMTGTVSDYLTEEVRRFPAFSRVVSQRDVEAVLSLERQRQMMDCNAASCVAEIAGALGVDLVLIGSLGRVGAVAILTVRVVRVKDGNVVASGASRTCGEKEEYLVYMVRPLLERVLVDAQLLGRPAAPVPFPPEDCAALSTYTPPPREPATAPPAGSSGRWLKIAGGILVGTAVPALPVALLAGTAAVAGLLGAYLVPAFRAALGGGRANFWLAHVPPAAGAGVAALSLLVGVLLLGAGAGALAAGVLQ